MLRTYKVMLILGLTMFGLWGCSKANPTDSGTSTAKIQRLEDDLRSMTAERDSYRQKLSNTEDQLRTEIYRTQALDKERGELIVKLREKTEEAKELTVHFDGFRKNIKDLLGQAETTLAPKSKTTNALPTSFLKPELKN